MMRMERVLSWTCQLLFVSLVFLSYAHKGDAGLTSTFVRSEWPATDIPLDNEVFAVPKGHNAPQQVSIYTPDSNKFGSSTSTIFLYAQVNFLHYGFIHFDD